MNRQRIWELDALRGVCILCVIVVHTLFDLVYFAGGETQTGRDTDHMSMGCSLEFVMGGVDYDKYNASELRNKDPKWIHLLTDAVRAGKIPDIDDCFDYENLHVIVSDTDGHRVTYVNVTVAPPAGDGEEESREEQNK